MRARRLTRAEKIEICKKHPLIKIENWLLKEANSECYILISKKTKKEKVIKRGEGKDDGTRSKASIF